MSAIATSVLQKMRSTPPFVLGARRSEIPAVLRALLILAAWVALARPLSSQAADQGGAEGTVRSRADSTIAAAFEALAQGLPWRASQMLGPILRDSVRRTPSAVLLAATAASRWGGWSEVQRLLAGAQWTEEAGGATAELLAARAAVELGADSAAAAEAR